MIIFMLKPKKIKTKRLKRRSNIDYLFEKGVIAKSKNLLLKYVEEPNSGFYYSGVSVAKKRFKKATDRNHIKRILRVAVGELSENDLFEGSGMLLYQGNLKPNYSQLVLEVASLFSSLKEN